MTPQIPYRNSRPVARRSASFCADGLRARSRDPLRSRDGGPACRTTDIFFRQVQGAHSDTHAYLRGSSDESASPTPLFSEEWQKSAQVIEKKIHQPVVFSDLCALFPCNHLSFNILTKMTRGYIPLPPNFARFDRAPFARRSSLAARHWPEAALLCSEPFASLEDSPLHDA